MQHYNGTVSLGGVKYSVVPANNDITVKAAESHSGETVLLMNSDANGMKCLATSYDRLFKPWWNSNKNPNEHLQVLKFIDCNAHDPAKLLQWKLDKLLSDDFVLRPLYYEGHQDGCLKADGVEVKVVECPSDLQGVAVNVRSGKLVPKAVPANCLQHAVGSSGEAKVKVGCNGDDSSTTFVSVIPYRSQLGYSQGGIYNIPSELENVFPQR